MNKNQSDAGLASLRKFFKEVYLTFYLYMILYKKNKGNKIFLFVSETDCTNEKSLANGVV